MGSCHRELRRYHSLSPVPTLSTLPQCVRRAGEGEDGHVNDGVGEVEGAIEAGAAEKWGGGRITDEENIQDQQGRPPAHQAQAEEL
jgi:hypothetical protein